LGPPPDDVLSAVLEVSPPVDEFGNYSMTAGEPYDPDAAVWTYVAPPENFSAIASGAQRLQNENTLITYGPSGTIVEVTPSGEVVWKYVNPYTSSGMLGPMDPIPPFSLPPLLDNFVFRATSYSQEFIAGIPEPSTMLLAAIGILALTGGLRKRV